MVPCTSAGPHSSRESFVGCKERRAGDEWEGMNFSRLMVPNNHAVCPLTEPCNITGIEAATSPDSALKWRSGACARGRFRLGSRQRQILHDRVMHHPCRTLWPACSRTPLLWPADSSRLATQLGTVFFLIAGAVQVMVPCTFWKGPRLSKQRDALYATVSTYPSTVGSIVHLPTLGRLNASYPLVHFRLPGRRPLRTESVAAASLSTRTHQGPTQVLIATAGFFHPQVTLRTCTFMTCRTF